ncbi:MAG TPA: SRPBCC family protein [Solirubrobacteraceae bacterium]|jgi:ribosome-associated toxin RatA of RatAB toxin-antitoxin module
MLEGENSIEVKASCEECFGLVVRLDRYPEWQSQVRAARVIERDAEGRPIVGETVSDARVREIKYRLRYHHEPPHRMSWTYMEGDVKDLHGEYRFEPLDDSRTRVTFRLVVDPGRRLGLLLRGRLADKVRDHVMRTTLQELKTEVERDEG